MKLIIYLLLLKKIIERKEKTPEPPFVEEKVDKQIIERSDIEQVPGRKKKASKKISKKRQNKISKINIIIFNKKNRKRS